MSQQRLKFAYELRFLSWETTLVHFLLWFDHKLAHLRTVSQLANDPGFSVITTTRHYYGFCSHSARSGTEHGNVTRSPTRHRCRHQSRVVFAFTQKAFRQFAGNFPGSMRCVKGAKVTLFSHNSLRLHILTNLRLYLREYLKWEFCHNFVCFRPCKCEREVKRHSSGVWTQRAASQTARQKDLSSFFWFNSTWMSDSVIIYSNADKGWQKKWMLH